MELIAYDFDYEDIVVEMFAQMTIHHLNLLNKEYEYSYVLKEAREDLEMLLGTRHKIYLGQVEDEIVGFIMIDFRSREACWIDDLFVVEEKRRQGYGSAMILEATKLVKSVGYQSISIDVVPRNIEAIKLYFKLGFDSISLLTLRNDFNHEYRNKEIELFGEKFKY